MVNAVGISFFSSLFSILRRFKHTDFYQQTSENPQKSLESSMERVSKEEPPNQSRAVSLIQLTEIAKARNQAELLVDQQKQELQSEKEKANQEKSQLAQEVKQAKQKANQAEQKRLQLDHEIAQLKQKIKQVAQEKLASRVKVIYSKLENIALNPNSPLAEKSSAYLKYKFNLDGSLLAEMLDLLIPDQEFNENEALPVLIKNWLLQKEQAREQSTVSSPHASTTKNDSPSFFLPENKVFIDTTILSSPPLREGGACSPSTESINYF